jgi:UDP-N-acetyl-D-mannosaminuronate dehydrogenase
MTATTSALESIAEGRLPFLEKKGGSELRRALRTGRLQVSAHIDALRPVDAAILTIGTPVDGYHNPLWNLLTECVDEVSAVLPRSAMIVLRSTISPGAIEFIDRHLTASEAGLPPCLLPRTRDPGKRPRGNHDPFPRS